MKTPACRSWARGSVCCGGRLRRIKEFDAFVEGCNARGLERFIEINQAAYDRYNGVA